MNIQPGDEVWEETGNCFGDKVRVRVVKVFPDGQCIVTDGETGKTRNSHVKRLLKDLGSA